MSAFKDRLMDACVSLGRDRVFREALAAAVLFVWFWLIWGML
jgi:hypothetical protein